MNELFTRISVRKYTDKSVEPEKINAILKAAMQAPSAGNQQPWEFYVVTDPDTIARLAKSSPYAGCTANAGTVIVPCYRIEGIYFPEYA
ncbi:MAG: nitroreductase family protein, partial [Eubacterium sp.]|nr:nitroreductase family protein [Eubacterium sp.]